jgi:hypothetical protein
MSPRANYTDRCFSAKLVPTFADRVCRVVSATDSLWPYSRVSRPEPLSSSSVVIKLDLSEIKCGGKDRINLAGIGTTAKLL